MEHVAATSNPDMRVLRDVGTESPSGRLVVDISRLRETGALTSGASELTLLTGSAPDQTNIITPVTKPSFPRVNVALQEKKKSTRNAILVVGFLVLAAIAGATTLIVQRLSSLRAVPDTNTSAVPSPVLKPSVSPTPASSPLPSPSPKRTANKANANGDEEENANNNANVNANAKKEKKTFFGKIKSLFTREKKSK
jgi:hypothetical protein